MFKLKHILGLGFALAAAPAWAVPIITTGTGANAAAIQGAVDAFRGALGNPNNGNAPGPLPDGRREINWDGGGDATQQAGNPFAGFQVTRGALFTTPAPGTGFLQAPPTGGPQGGLATFFSNPTYGAIFGTFSSPRLFVPIGNNITDVVFSIPGLPGEAALTEGFGAVFADVDILGATTIQFFGLGGANLGTFNVPVPTANNGLSFLGVQFTEGAIVGRIRITTGNSALGPNDSSTIDVVAMDDFLFGEPLAVPEPSLLSLLLAGAAALMLRRPRRQRSN